MTEAIPTEQITTIEQATDFSQPRKPFDSWVQDVNKQLGLGDSPSLEEIESIATVLLADSQTVWAGTEMVLNRRVTVQSEIMNESDVLAIIHTPELTGSDRFSFLLLQYAIEKAQAARVTE